MSSATELIKNLREMTGCGVVDCQQALREEGDDLERAVVLLRQKGKAKAAKKAQRETHEGAVVSYVHSNGKIGVLVSLRCETDFVARNERFLALAHDIALHVAAMDPMAVQTEDIADDLLAEEKSIAEQQAKTSGKPAEIQAKMVEGRLKKFKEERTLLPQAFVKDPNKTVQDLINEAVATLGENITVGGFKRLEV